MKTPLRFLLAGNSTYRNRGSEAIVRGTTAILRRVFGQDVTFALAQFGESGVITAQNVSDPDRAITHIPLSFDRFSTTWLRDQFHRRLKIGSHGRHCMLKKEVRRVCASLQVGGDNYSLDYGFPYPYFSLDDYLIRQKVPVVLWGASVGPFDADPAFGEIAHAHLRGLNAIFVRESRSLEYVQRYCEKDRVRLVADPAFAMAPVEPRSELVPTVDLGQKPIGLNFSPLMARYVTKGDMDAWAMRCAESVICIMKRASENVVLVPHVFAHNNDDGVFLTDVAERVSRMTGTSVCVASRELSAAEIKWVISHCSVFVGARTHSTIASFSSGIPTLSLAYSVKAKGLSMDIFGDLEYCIDSNEMTAGTIANRTLKLLVDAERVREHLAGKIPQITARAFAAGEYLAEFCGARLEER